METSATNRFIEILESRDLKTVTYSSGSTPSDPSGTYFGAVIFGDNGNDPGVPTASAGVGDDTSGVAYITWDQNPWDGVDNGGTSVTFAVNIDSSHAGTFAIGDDNSIGFNVDSSQQVHSVTLRGLVTGPGMAFDWSDVQVSFYSGGSLVESQSVSTLQADTMDSTNWDPEEAMAVVTPTASNVDGVKITATAHLQSTDGTYPGWTDISGQIFVS